jgi:hypothetical protein
MSRILAYSHIPKAGGRTLIGLLRGCFGVAHIDVEHRFPSNAIDRWYRKKDLTFDIRIHPWVKSLAGHWLRPYIDFGEYENRLQWYTFVRKPTDRSFSQYFQDIELGRITDAVTFADWSQIRHLGGRNRNAQVRQICGKESAQLAIETIEKKNIFVGVLEEYDLSLKTWRAFIGYPRICLEYRSRKNVRSDKPLYHRIRDRQPNIDRHLAEHNTEDHVLYQYVCDVVFPEQIAAFGGKDALEAQTMRPLDGVRQRVGLCSLNRLYRNLVYKPVVKLSCTVSRAGSRASTETHQPHKSQENTGGLTDDWREK